VRTACACGHAGGRATRGVGAYSALPRGADVTSAVYCLRMRQCSGFVFFVLVKTKILILLDVMCQHEACLFFSNANTPFLCALHVRVVTLADAPPEALAHIQRSREVQMLLV